MSKLVPLTKESLALLENRAVNYIEGAIFYNLDDALNFVRSNTGPVRIAHNQGDLFGISDECSILRTAEQIRATDYAVTLNHDAPLTTQDTSREKFIGDYSWVITMSEGFIKCLSKVDKKLMGRVLEAMIHVCKEPMTIKGDTIKPLNSDLKGLWRCRIGDYRLIYKPDAPNRRIDLLAFASRGDIY